MIYQNYWRKYVNDVSLQLEVVWAGLVFHLSVGALLPLQLQKHAESLSIESCCQKIRPLNSLTLHLGKIRKRLLTKYLRFVILTSNCGMNQRKLAEAVM